MALVPGWISTGLLIRGTGSGGRRNASVFYEVAHRLHVFMLYLFGLFLLAFEYGVKGIRSLKPVKVGASLT